MAIGTSPPQHTRRLDPEGGNDESPGSSGRAEKRTTDSTAESGNGARGRSQSKTAVEVFMSRLEGERGPQNRRESMAAFKDMLTGCSTNNSVRFENTATVGSRHGGSSSVTDEKEAHGADLRRVRKRREEAQRVVSGLMGTAEGSYMLSLEADSSKICLSRTQSETNPPPVGVVRVSTARM